ncbi:C-type lectin domain family 10 member A-like isoform X5 [Poecilia formosa]|uniref:C-type lectin domain family 10 member A-like isoform X5 n=1 Tax=Poecilia formosa TaxID=48698 RepID=UPI0007B97821|nr:PREDICTED: C-type lectin domain family 10 member A-like isoform X5 [Poecilia formosa]
MEDSEVQYATVVFKNLPRTKKEEEVVYDEVKKTNQTSQQTFDTNGLLSDMEAERRHWYQKFACCFGSLCVILVMMIIGVSVYFVFQHRSDEQQLIQLRTNQTFLLEENINLTRDNNKLSSDFTIQVYNLTQQKQNLTEELSQVKKTNQELQTDKETLTRQIETMKKTWNEQKLRIRNEYCHRRNNERSSSCQNGWTHCQSSCYAVNNARPPKGKTWTEAQEDCKQKTSHLAVVGSEEKKLFLDNTSWNANGITGYWIGLRAEGRRWKWINGSDLTHQAWMQQPATDGQCVTSLQNREWKSVRCTEKNAWICEKKALSV